MTIDADFKKFRMVCYPLNISDAQENCLRQAFFAGAISFQTLVEEAKKNAPDTSAFMREVTMLMGELQAFSDDQRKMAEQFVKLQEEAKAAGEEDGKAAVYDVLLAHGGGGNA